MNILHYAFIDVNGFKFKITPHGWRFLYERGGDSCDFSSGRKMQRLLVSLRVESGAIILPIHRIHKWRTRGKKMVPSHESEGLEDKQKLQMKTFSELAECLARIPPKITLYGRLFKYNYVRCLQL